MSGPKRLTREPTDDRLERLRGLFPEAFPDGTLDLAALRSALEPYGVRGDGLPEDPADGHYGLRWPGKQEASRLASQAPSVTLRPMPGAGVDEDRTGNLVLVGDNLRILLALRKSYAGSVKLITLDPPYNTGRDFLYKDRFAVSEARYRQEARRADPRARLGSESSSSGRLHANWLNFIYPRLQVSRSLLRPDGLVAIHIDEHELENLVLLGKEIFGEENYLGTVVWDKGNPKGDANGLAYQHESIVFFARDAGRLPALQRAKPNAQRMLDEARRCVAQSGDLQAAREAWAARVRATPGLSGGEAMYNRLDDSGRVYRLVSMAWPNKKRAPDDYFRPLIHPVTGQPCPVPARGWRNPPATMDRLLAEGLVEFGADHTVQPQRRYFLDEHLHEKIPSILRFAGSDDAMLQELGIPFEHPKPVAFAAQLIGWLTQPGDLVLDFFAGSGTTGHASWLAGQEGGDRRFLLVQIDAKLEGGGAHARAFPDLAALTCERLRRASGAMKLAGATGDLGFRVFREDTPALARSAVGTQPAPTVRGELSPDALFAEVLLLLGFPLDARVAELPRRSANTLWRVEHPRVPRPLLLCLDAQLDEDLLPTLRAHPGHTFVCRDEALSEDAKRRLSDALASIDAEFRVL